MMSSSAPPRYHNQLFTARASEALDQASIREFGLPGFTLMELAATGVAAELRKVFAPKSRALICCGTGNNGGDALALARLLAEAGHEIHVYAPGGLRGLSKNAAHNCNLLKILKQKGTPGRIFLPEIPEELPHNANTDFDAVIDGLLGTGLSRPVEGHYHDAITFMNRLDAPVYALDIPSGLSADTGEVLGVAVKAAITFMLGTRKRGCYLGEGPDYCGRHVFCPLPFPGYLAERQFRKEHADQPVWLWQATAEADMNITKKSRPEHKYENGNVYLAAGSPGLTGAAILAAKAAWNTGCGSVAVFAPRELMPAYDAHFVEQTRIAVSSDGDGYFNEHSADEIIEQLRSRPGVLVLGPGLGRGAQAVAFVKKLLTNLNTPVILDADGFTALAAFDSLEDINPGLPLLVTPHPGEQQRLHGKHADNPETLQGFLSAFPCRRKMFYLAKGFPLMMASHEQTLITDYDSRLFNRTGYGDLLSGYIAGYLSQTEAPDALMNMQKAAQKGLLTGYEQLTRLIRDGKIPAASTILSETEAKRDET